MSDAVATKIMRGARRAVIARLSASALRQYGLAISVLVAVLVLSLASPNFLTTSNLMNIILQSANIALMAAGMTLVLITGEVDLSVASIQSLGAVTVALLMKNHGVPVIPAILIALLAGATAGSVSGFFVGRFLIPAFIVTLAMDSFARGTALIVSEAGSIYGLPSSFAILGQGYLGPVPVAALVASIVFLLVHLLLRRTVFGINIYAVGGNKEAARVAGINVGLVKGVVLAISGSCAGLAGIVMASRLNSAQAILGLFDLMDVIAAVVIGGTSLMGGEGSVLGTVIGTLFIAVIRNGLNLLGVTADWQLLAIGMIIILAVLIDYVGRR